MRDNYLVIQFVQNFLIITLFVFICTTTIFYWHFFFFFGLVESSTKTAPAAES
ncbi:hypothetical protein LguiB_018373 [Lonicera macranthoides]